MGLVDDLLNFQENTYCSAIRGYLARDEKRRVEEYLWGGRISVGAFTSWDCCPKQIVEDSKKTHRWPVELLYKFGLGHAYHAMYQKAAMNTPNLKMIKPWNLPDIQVKEWDGSYKSYQQKLDECWPEIPVTYRDTEGNIIIAGRADEVEIEYRKPVVLDIKSVNDDPEDFRNKFEELYLDPDGLFYKKHQKYKIQATIYGILMNQDQYWAPLTVDRFKLLYVNTNMPVGSPDSEREVLDDILDMHYTKFNLMASETLRQLQKEGWECKYRYCAIHGD